MLKKSIFCFCGLFSSFAFADHAYLGLNVGAEFMNASREDVLENPGGPIIWPEFNRTTRACSVLGNIVLGYQWDIGSVFVAPEIYGQFSPSKKTLTRKTITQPRVDNFKTDLSKKWSAGFGVRVGTKIKAFSPYAKVGLDYARFSYTFKEIARDKSMRQQYERHSWKPGLVLGGGVEAAVTSRMNVRLEYTWKAYSALSHSIQATGIGNMVHLKAKSVRSHAVTLGAMYRF